MSLLMQNIINSVNTLNGSAYYGQVTAVQGLFIEVSGIRTRLSIGDRCNVLSTAGRKVPCELVSFKGDKLLLMPYGSLEGIGLGCRVEVENASPVIYPHPSWLGRIINAFGEAIDGKGPLLKGSKPYFIKASPPPAQFRDRVCGKVDLGVRAVNTFLTICKGQRMGIFAGSGVGKSTLMSMLAKHSNADVSVIGLIGERGREAKEFVEDTLGEEGLAKSVLVLATSDEPADASAGRVCSHGGFRIFPRFEQGRPVHDGFDYPFCHGSARDISERGRASGVQRLYAERLR